MKYLTTYFFLLALLFASCTTHQKVVQTQPQVQEVPIKSDEPFLKRKVAIGRFSNETMYGKGVFYTPENDPMPKQAGDILATKLAASNKFILLERQDADKIAQEMAITGNHNNQRVGADYLIIGSITEFGRKNTGDVDLFSRSKTQTVQAGVSLRLVDVATGQIIYSEEAKGEAEATAKSVMGLGGRADFDATLSDKAISAAISKLVENIINKCTDNLWTSYFLSFDDNAILISGGTSQGIKVGNTFDVVERGKVVKNPQTGMDIELPGKIVGRVQIDFCGGDNPQNEYSIVSFLEGSIDKTRLNDYVIREIKR